MSATGAADQALQQRFVNAPIKVTSSGSTARSSQLSPGRYRIVADEDCYIRQGNSAVEASSTSGHLLPAGAIDYLTVDHITDDRQAPNDYVAVISKGSSAVLELLAQR